MLLSLVAAAAAKSLQCLTLCDPIDGSPPGSPSLEFSREEHWSGLPFPSPVHESEKWKWSSQLSPTLSDPMDCSPPGSSVLGIFQARVLEWGAIALLGRTKAAYSLHLILSQYWGRTFWTLYLISHEFNDFPLWLGETDTIFDLYEFQRFFFLCFFCVPLLSWVTGSFLIHMCWRILPWNFYWDFL